MNGNTGGFGKTSRPDLPSDWVVRPATTADAQNWQTLMQQHGGHWSLDWRWQQVFNQAYGLESFYHLAQQGSKTVGIMPLIRHPAIKTGWHALPFLDYAPPLTLQPSMASAMVAHLLSQGQTIELRHIESQPETQAAPGTMVTMILPLPHDQNMLWKGFSSKVRNQVRKAEKSGITVIQGRQHLPVFYHLWRERMRQLGTPAHARSWFTAIMDHFEEAQIFIAMHQDKPVGGLFHLRVGQTALVPWAASKRELRSLCINHALYWAAMEHSLNMGATQFDFLRSQVGQGTYSFKKQWGAQAYALSYLRYRPDGSIKDCSHPGKGRAKQLFSRLWPHLPDFLRQKLDTPLRLRIP
ncbi:GNAT family N-acetyltransferase [Magnetococcus sp. PR-3]|uniref:GNAT family N-acetyltransferase n=1 Tax=Magnetococcus sp. PR-3 TaxID=3120355 RepID=UPI002FCDF1E5